MAGNKKNRVLLAFSGGLDTSAIVPWLKERYDAEVLGYCSDLGNSPDGKALDKWAKELGITQLIFEDLRDHFAKDFAFRAVRAGAVYQDEYLLGTSLGRPLIAERMAHFARELGATHIAHGATGKGNDQLRFEKSWAYLVPEIQVIAPWKEWEFKGRADLVAYLAKCGFPRDPSEKLFSVDVNLFHRSCEGGILENPGEAYDPAQIYEWVKAPAQLAAAKPASVTVAVAFEKGMPVKLDGQAMGPAALLGRLNALAGERGIGVVDLVEERANGIKSRGVYETPGGTLLHQAMRSLKHLCWDRALMDTSRQMGLKYADLVYDGNWHSDVRRAIDAFFDSASDTLTGEVKLRLESGFSRVESRASKYALYDSELVSFESDTQGLHQYALGYSRTVSFSPLRAGKRDQKSGRGALL